MLCYVALKKEGFLQAARTWSSKKSSPSSLPVAWPSRKVRKEEGTNGDGLAMIGSNL